MKVSSSTQRIDAKSVFCDWIELKRNGYLANNDRLNPLKIDFPSRRNSGFCFVKVTIILILPLSDTRHTYIYIGHNRSRLTCCSTCPTAYFRWEFADWFTMATSRYSTKSEQTVCHEDQTVICNLLQIIEYFIVYM